MQVPVSTYNVSINFNALEKRIEQGRLSSRQVLREKNGLHEGDTQCNTRVSLARPFPLAHVT